MRYSLLGRIPFSKAKYERLKKRSENFLLTPLKVISLLIAISGLFAMIFEVRHFSEHSIQVYLTRLSATLVAFLVLVSMNTKFGAKRPVLLVHVLLLAIIISSAYMISLMPSTLIVNSQIVGLIIFTSALFLSWEVKNQILVAIYYNIVFATAIIGNDSSIYFLPNMYETVIFVLFLSVLSVIGSAVNFKLRMQAVNNAQKVKASERKFKALFEHSAEGRFQSTLDGKFIIVNSTMVKIFGYSSAEEMLDIDISNDLFKNTSERAELIAILEEKGIVENYQITLKKKNGDEVIVKLNDRFVKGENGNAILEGSIQDITAQFQAEIKRKITENELHEEKKKSDRLAQEAMQLTRAKSQFLANMSHEIRTPMNGILGYLSLIDKNPFRSTDELKDYIKGARHSAESLLSIIDSILDLSKVESGRMELEKVNFSIKKVIEESISINLTRATDKGLVVGYDIDSEVPQNLNGDPVKVRQILVNLISNAIKFTDIGYVKVQVSIEEKNDTFINLLFVVSDTGIGIPENKLNQLFQPFMQLDGSYTRKYGGTGLGLAISKSFVEMMGGNIRAESNIGKGTKFIFNLKLNKTDELAENMEKNVTSEEFADSEIIKIPSYKLLSKRKEFRILIAEDNVINQKVVSKILADFGYKCESVSNGEEAVIAVNERNYNAVLMDIQMPGMDGLEATKHIRNLEDGKNDIPIIAMTAHALVGDKEKCLEAGMNEYLSKPISAEKLIGKLDSVLSLELDEIEEIIDETSNYKDVFNFGQLEKVSLSDEDFQKDLLTTYFIDIESRIQKLEELYSSKDMDRLVKEAHTIKGSSSSLGAVKLAEEALGIEISGKNNDFNSVSDRLKNIKTALNETRDMVKHLFDDAKALE